jgi:hypothetical protein
VDGLVIMVLGIVFLGTATGTLHKYMDYRVQLAERLGTGAERRQGGDRSVLKAIEELRAEIAALRQHESDAILSFDSTLHTLDARLKHVERQALGEGMASSPGPGPAAARPEQALRRQPSSAGPPGAGGGLPAR